MSPLPKTTFPIIDIGSLYSDENSTETHHMHSITSEVAAELLSAFETKGMAYLHFSGPSLPHLTSAVTNAVIHASQFFSRPLSEKLTATPGTLPPGVTRGYLSTGTESGATQFESKEAFSWSYNWDSTTDSPQNNLEAPNVWPESPAGEPVDRDMKQAFDSLFTFMNDVMFRLVTNLTTYWPSKYPPLPDLRTQCMTGTSISLLRAFHYHPTALPTSHTGSSPHTDWGFATLIAQQVQTASALQVFHDNAWVDIPPLPNTLIVNCSDFLSMLTDGLLRSPLHRVILTPTSRISFVYFQYPGFQTVVPSLSPAGKKATSDLSLLKDQSSNPSTGIPAHEKAASFGELIALKWQQVSR